MKNLTSGTNPCPSCGWEMHQETRLCNHCRLKQTKRNLRPKKPVQRKVDRT